MHTSLFSILLATAVGIVVANILYSPYLIGKIWAKEIQSYLKNPQQAMKRQWEIYGLFYIYLLFVSTVMGELVFASYNYYGGNKLLIGILTGFSVWLGISTPIQFLDYMSEGKPLKLFLINIFYQLLSLTMIGATLGLLTNKYI